MTLFFILAMVARKSANHIWGKTNALPRRSTESMKQEYRQSGSGYREGLSGFAYTRQIICFRKENKADNQVNLPGGITMNGDQILAQGREDLKELETRFALDWSDPPLDMVG